MVFVLKEVTLQPDESGEIPIPEGWEPVAADRVPTSRALRVVLMQERPDVSEIQTKLLDFDP